jgi:hypothetical protein
MTNGRVRCNSLPGAARRRIPRLCVLPCMCLLTAASLMADDAPRPNLATVAARIRAVTPPSANNPAGADALYHQARKADCALQDRAAAAGYWAALQLDPEHIQALEGLAYLQATSGDRLVRDETAALVNAGRALGAMFKTLIRQRAELTPSALAELKIQVLNTMAAAAAANQEFTSAEGLAEQALQHAQALAEQEPTNEHEKTVSVMYDNLAAIRSHLPFSRTGQVWLPALE